MSLRVFVSVGSLLGALGCRTESQPEAEKVSAAGSARARAEREVELEVVSELPIEQAVEVAGTLAPDEQVVVAAKVAGRVASISFDLASVVKKGQTLATLEPADFVLRVEQAEAARAQALAELGLPASGATTKVDPEATAVVREARATLNEAQANAARTRALAAEGLATGVQLDAAEAALVRAQTAVQTAIEQVRIREASVGQRRTELGLARQQLADTGIRAPLDGVVQQRFVNVGEYLTVGAPVAEIVRIDPLRLRVAVPEREAVALRIGLPVQVRVEGDTKAHAGTLSRVAPALDLESRTLLVEADLPNQGELRPGSFARARIVVATKQAPTVPKSAVVTFAGLTKVLTVDRGKAVERRITLGKAVGERVEVVSGLKTGEAVVIRPGSLQQGERVRVRAASPAK